MPASAFRPRLAAHAVRPAARSARSLADRCRDSPILPTVLPVSPAGTARPHGDHAFSVAQHSLVVEQIFRRCRIPDCTADQTARWRLLHDAPEYVIGDMISPFKAVVGGGYKVGGDSGWRPPSTCAFRCRPSVGRPEGADQEGGRRVRLFRGHAMLAGFSEAEAREVLRPAARRHGRRHDPDPADGDYRRGAGAVPASASSEIEADGGESTT